ncbi:hypothetical protein RIF29_28210 [Crotalaria pallida]|uniref:F-box domain-containing protein n=1 Tax=Crotalaria pallida TaxID=3830 RepID=A0AAN9EQK1_CROPI
MIDILSRVPAECLINSARYVCKPWATLIASSHFADAHVRHAHASSSQLISLVVADFAMTTEKYCLYSLYTKDKYRTDFRLPTRMMRYSALVNSCDGIMLMLCFDDTTGCFVVNPVLKCWLSLPPLPAPIDLVCDSDLAIVRVPRSTAKFKVFLLIPNVVYVLTIGIDISWREIYRKEANVSIDFYHAVCSGANDLYWIRRDGVTGIDIDKEIITWKYPLPSLPNGFFVNYLCMGNHLSCVLNLNQNTKTSFGKAKIYILDTDIGKWSLFHEMGPFDFVPAFDCEHYDAIVSRFCFWIKEQLIFRASLNPIRKEGEEEIKGHDRYVYFSYNVKTRKATKIEGIDENLRHMYLHTSSLVSLPTTLT